ncbi:MAG: hypothetical protein PHV34_17780 [Verrucomicrobiae bacterium]|nr:hypothetical protein [Verrucomicrobiae bacterium]
MKKKTIHGRAAWKRFGSRSGQALSEVVAGSIALALVFLGVLFLSDLSRARLQAILASRPEAGLAALSGMSVGSPVYYGSAGSVEQLCDDVLSVSQTPVDYSLYTAPSYNYMQENLVEPLYAAGNTMVSTLGLSVSEKTCYVTNNQFLVDMKVGASKIPVTQKTCMPLMKSFP